MSEPIVEEKKTEEKKVDPQKEYNKLHNKSIRQLAKEGEKKEEVKVEEKEAPVEEKIEVKEEIKKEEAIVTPKKEEKAIEVKEEPKINPEEIAKKAAEEASKRVAEETKKEFQEEIEKILNKDKDIQEQQKEADELVAAWEKEGRLPKDYPELISETMRIAEKKMEIKMREQEEAKQAEIKKQEEEKAAQTKAEETKQAEQKKAFEEQIVSDLNDIYSAGMLPRPANIEEINNPETQDTAAKETQEVIKFGIELNTKRVSEGLPPVTSLNKIFFLHYKPFKDAQPAKPSSQSAGADAPISQGSNQSSTQQPNNDALYVRQPDGSLKAKSWAQLRWEAIQARLGNKK